MKNRIGIFWLATLTVYMAYTTTDTYAVLKSVQSNQGYTLQYMEKSVSILQRIKRAKLIEPLDEQSTKSEQVASLSK